MTMINMTLQEYLDANANSIQAHEIKGDRSFNFQRMIYALVHGFDMCSGMNPNKDKIIITFMKP